MKLPSDSRTSVTINGLGRAELAVDVGVPRVTVELPTFYYST